MLINSKIFKLSLQFHIKYIFFINKNIFYIFPFVIFEELIWHLTPFVENNLPTFYKIILIFLINICFVFSHNTYNNHIKNDEMYIFALVSNFIYFFTGNIIYSIMFHFGRNNYINNIMMEELYEMDRK